jgi:SOS-response transcriptional repressor LexA
MSARRICLQLFVRGSGGARRFFVPTHWRTNRCRTVRVNETAISLCANLRAKATPSAADPQRDFQLCGFPLNPVYDLTAAAGFWGPESVPEEIGWTEVPDVAVKPGMFVARVTGTSMEPLIPDGSWCLFRPCPAGSREGRIVLVQFSSLGAGENGGRFTVKKYRSEKPVTADGWRHDRIQLLPVNPAFEPITLEPEEASDLLVAGEFVKSLCRTTP